MNSFFPEIKKNFGFGMMRLPMIGDDVDIATTTKMVDEFLAAGFNYFDTAHPYIQGKSEQAVKTCLADRYPREQFQLANKLSFNCFETEEEVRPLVESQLKACGVEYFDFFLLHAMNLTRYEKYKACRCFEIARELKAEGKVRHIGMSFHDSAEALDKILTWHPELEFVQIQFNYVDYEDPKVQSRACYEVCRKHNKPVMIMEPAKGGSLITEGIYDTRFRYTAELNRMGANVQVEGKAAVIDGVKNLHGCEVRACDLRAGAAMVIAALAAEGTTTIEDAHYIERGYEDIIGKLTDLGANITRKETFDPTPVTAGVG